MIPFILAAVGGYLIGDSMKDSQKFAKGGNIKQNFTLVTPSGDDESDFKDEEEKINLLRKKVDFDEVRGSIDYEDEEDNTNLKFYKDGKLVMTLKGSWVADFDERTGMAIEDQLRSTIEIDGEKVEFNYHPYGSLGGIDFDKLKKNIDKAFKELNSYSVVVSIEGYEEYSEDVDGLENAKARLEDIKGNTKFQVVKGSTVGVGKLVDDSRVVMAKGGSVDMDRLKMDLESIKKKYPNAKVSYTFAKDSSGKGYVITAKENNKTVYTSYKMEHGGYMAS